VHPADLFCGLHAKDTHSFWLDREHHPTERFSIIGGSGRVVDEVGVDWLADELAAEDDVDLPFSFRPGWVGFVDYEGRSKFMHVDRALVLDHDGMKIYFVGEFDSSEEFEYWHHAALLRIGVSGGEQAMYKLKNPALLAKKARVRHSDDKYLALIAETQKLIAAGDVYQLCLTNEISLEVSGNALHTFLKLRETNPAPYSSYLRIGNLELVCCSPEQFVKASALGQISSKPIKGTRPRHQDPVADAEAVDELRNNEKERAENLMIVDLMRNDFGRVADADSVTVPKLFDVESYASVHQLVSTVEARLAPGKTVVDALNSAFPGGSMTGAPKHRAMEIIRDLEAGERGVYSGVMGYLTHGGVAEFCMVIRTLVVNGAKASIGVGGGITIDSQPQAELQETKIKARALLAALEASDPWANW
jgi:para-aminobenzoate synthetase